MYAFQQTVKAKEGCLGELVELTKAATTLLNEMMPEVKVSVFVDALGKLPLGQWQMECESLALYDVAREQGAFNELFVPYDQRLPALLVEGSGRDMFCQPG